MKQKLLKALLCSLIFASGLVSAAEKTVVDVYQLNDKKEDKGIGSKIGTITFEDSQKGMLIKLDLQGLPEGQHGFHIHQNPACEGGMKDGKWTPGLAAGDHFDPQHTHKHLGPYGHGHLGDMPFIVVDKDGTAKKELVAPHLKVSEILQHSLMIHEHGDNYSDQPKPLGGGGARIACGVIK